MPVDSNLVLRTSVPKPTGPGFTNVIERLRTIKKLLTEIEKSSVIEIKIRVQSEVPDEFKIQPKQTAAAKKATAAQAVAAAGGPAGYKTAPVHAATVQAAKQAAKATAQAVTQAATAAATKVASQVPGPPGGQRTVTVPAGRRSAAGSGTVPPVTPHDPYGIHARTGKQTVVGSLPTPQTFAQQVAALGGTGPVGIGPGGGTQGPPRRRPPTGGGPGGAGGGGGGGPNYFVNPHNPRFPGGIGDQYHPPAYTMGTRDITERVGVVRPIDKLTPIETAVKTRGDWKPGAEEGDEPILVGEKYTEKQKFANVEKGILHTAERTVDSKGEQVALDEKSVDLAQQQKVTEQTLLSKGKARLDQAKQEYKDRLDFYKRQGFAVTKDVDYFKEGIKGVPQTFGKYGRTTLQKTNALDPGKGARVTLDESGRVFKAEAISIKVSKEANKLYQERLQIKKDLFDETQKAIQAELALRKAAGYTQKTQETHKRRYLPSGLEKATFEKGVLSRPSAAGDGKEDLLVYNEFTGAIREYTAVNKEAAAAIAKTAKAQHAAASITDLQSRGYQIASERFTRMANGQFEAFTELSRVSGNILTGYSVDLATVNTRTGNVVTSTLMGAKAMRYMGDSAVRAIAKVMLWGSATTIVFGFTAAIGAAVGKMIELEQNTILLSRVGKGLGDTLEERISEAYRLTNEILALSAAMSSDAGEAQRAAAVFARTGQSRVEILESTRAALLASRIAELDVEESAQLLSAALSQFKLSASDLIPTLDTLNELSNNYRVTTDDLLQSISRTGSVIDQHGGRLSELAAITAVVAQTTARTGAEIGNAIKTISSRLAGEDVAMNLFEKAGISAIDASGNARGLSEVLLDLQGAFASLNQAEQDQLTISIAGIRQRNILIAAVEQAVNAAIAESKALRVVGSAMAEQKATSVTLEAALKTLRGTFFEIAHDVGADLLPVLKAIVYIIQRLAELLAFADSSPARLLAVIAVMYALHAIAIKLGPTFKALTASVLDHAAASMYNVQVSTRQAGALAAVGIAAKGAAAAMGTAMLATIKANAAMLAFMAVMYIFIKILEKKASIHAQEKQNIEDATSAASRDAAAARKRTTAVQALTKALAAQLTVMKNLRGKVDPGSNKERKDAVTNIKKIADEAKHLGINIPVTFNAANLNELRALLTQFVAMNRQRIKDEIAEGEKELADVQGRQNKARGEAQTKADKFKRLRDVLTPRDAAGNRVNARAKDLAGMADFAAARSEALWEGLISDDDIEHAYEVTQESLVNAGDDLQDDIDDVGKKLEESRAKLGELGATNAAGAENRMAVASFENSIEAIEKFKKAAQIRGNLFDSVSATPLERAGKETTELTAHVDELWAMYNKVAQTNPNAPVLQEWKDKAAEATQAVVELHSNILKLQEEGMKKRITESYGFESTLNRSASKYSLLGKRRDADRAAGGVDTSANDDFAEGLVLRNNLLKESANLARVASEAGADPQEALAARELIQQNLNDLAQKEIELATVLREREHEIAEERKKSADEAQRALGLLSEEGKARMLIQADYFKKNPKAKISVEQQLAGSSETNKTTQDYFRDRVESYDEALVRGSGLAKGPLAQIRTEGMLQSDREQADLSKLTGGKNADQFSRDARMRAEQAANQRNRVAGEPELEMGFATRERLGRQGEFDVKLDTSAFDLKPLLDQFSALAVDQMNAVEARLVAQIERIRADLIKTPPRPPRAAV